MLSNMLSNTMLTDVLSKTQTDTLSNTALVMWLLILVLFPRSFVTSHVPIMCLVHGHMQVTWEKDESV